MAGIVFASVQTQHTTRQLVRDVALYSKFKGQKQYMLKKTYRTSNIINNSEDKKMVR